MNLTNEAICWLSLTEAGRHIRSGKLSSVAVTRALLERIATTDSHLHSYAHVTAEHALAQAAQADKDIAAGRIRGPLHGVPIALKDLCDTQGIVTTGGMPLHRNRTPVTDATVVSRLYAAGAVLLGKLQMTEGAFSAHHPDITVPVNPWGAAYWSGVSSSGSGVATAAGMCFGALGSDTLGSIRFPSTMNGVTGLKPTWGRVSRSGVLDLAPSMDHVGPMARCAEDVAAMLAVIAGHDNTDPTSSLQPVPDYVAALNAGVKGLRIGIDRELITANAEPEVAAVSEQAASVFAESGAEVIDIKFPDLRQATLDALQLCVAEAAVTHRDNYPAHQNEYGPVLSGLIEAGLKVDAETLIDISHRRERFTGEVAGVFAELDAVIMPAMNRAAPTIADLAAQVNDKAGRIARVLFTAPFDMSRSPALTLPGGVSDTGIPIGFQLIGTHFDEATLLNAGHAFQQHTEWHLRHPKESDYANH